MDFMLQSAYTSRLGNAAVEDIRRHTDSASFTSTYNALREYQISLETTGLTDY